MANLRIKDLTAEGTAQSTDVVELDRTAYADTHKITVDNLTALERTARQAQDDVIEASAGLTTAGAYDTDEDTYYLTAASFAAGVVNDGGATGALDETLFNADLILDANLKSVENRVATIENTYFTKEVEITHASILAMNSVPVTLVDYSADVVTAGYAVRVYAAEFVYGSSAAYNTNTNIYIASTSFTAEPQLENGVILTQASDRVGHFAVSAPEANGSMATDEDIVVYVPNGDPLGGTPGNELRIIAHCVLI